MISSIRLSAFLLAMGLAIGNAKPGDQDYCKTATKVSALPFSATPSTGKDGVWFKTEGILDGTDLILEIKGVEEDVRVDILMALDDEDNEYGEKCPADLKAPSDLDEASSVSSEDPIPAYSYFWTAQASAIYYVHVTSTSGGSDAKFEMTLRDINVLAIGNAKQSDYCKTATKVSSLPFSVNPSTGKDGVWFKTEGILDGTDLILEIKGGQEDVYADILMAADGDDSEFGKKCPDDLEAPSDLNSTSGINSEDPIPAYAYFWTAQASTVYYVHVISASGDSDATFEMTLRDLNGKVKYDMLKNSFDAEMTPRKSYLRAKA